MSDAEEPKRVTEPDAGRLSAALALAREQLDMDLAFVGEIVGDREIVRRADGDGDSFGLAEGASIELSETYCRHVLEGRLSGVVADAARNPTTAALAITARARVGAYVGVPLQATDARLYMLCCLAHESRPTLGEGDLRFMRGVGETVRAALVHEG